MGLELFSPDDDTSAVVTAIRMPEDIDGQAIVASMREESGVTIIGGQGQMRGHEELLRLHQAMAQAPTGREEAMLATVAVPAIRSIRRATR